MSDGSSNYTPGTSVRTGSATTYQHSGLKNTTDQTDASQTVTASRHYDAFGNLIQSSGDWKGAFGYAGSYGYQEDPNGLKLLGHRYYDPSTGRFLTQDPIQDGKNWYLYCSGNPISRADSIGEAWVVLGIDQRGVGHAWVMIIWDNGEVWIMENTMFGNNALYKSGVRSGRAEIEKFEGRADYEYWHYFDEKKMNREDVRGFFDARPNEYHFLTNSCVTFAALLYYDLTGIWLWDYLPVDIGRKIGRRNKSGQGKRPKEFGDIGTVPLTIGGGGSRIGG